MAHPLSPSSPPPSPCPDELTTATGVTVRLNDVPAPAPAPAVAWPPPSPDRVVVRPPADAHREHDAVMRALFREHGDFIRRTFLLRRGNVAEESTKDLAQRVMLVLDRRVALGKLPENVRGFLVETIELVLRNHRRRHQIDVERGVDAGEQPSPRRSPEGIAALAEDLRQLDEWLDALPERDAEALRSTEFEELTFEEAGEALGCPRGTVCTRVRRARKKLHEMALASRRPSDPPPRDDDGDPRT